MHSSRRRKNAFLRSLPRSPPGGRWSLKAGKVYPRKAGRMALRTTCAPLSTRDAQQRATEDQLSISPSARARNVGVIETPGALTMLRGAAGICSVAEPAGRPPAHPFAFDWCRLRADDPCRSYMSLKKACRARIRFPARGSASERVHHAGTNRSTVS